MPSARIGPYVLVRRLGGGAMGDVFEAEHVELGGRVAIKLMRVSAHGDDTAVRRALREGRAANAIVHPNVVKILDTGSHDGVPYLVMELLEGEDLASVLKREGHLRDARIAELLLPVVAGVAAAHRAGIVHRDLKPSNIVLARRHRKVEPVVVDFGISRSLHATVETKASAQGAGSILYMAPEQLRARAVTAKADQYALGVILYECATGGAPFYEEDHYALLSAIMTAPVVPPSEIAPGLSPEFDALVLRALARDPEERFASVEQLGAALLAIADASTRAAWAHELAPHAPPAPPGVTTTTLVSSASPVAKAQPPQRWIAGPLALVALAVVGFAVSHRATQGSSENETTPATPLADETAAPRSTLPSLGESARVVGAPVAEPVVFEAPASSPPPMAAGVALVPQPVAAPPSPPLVVTRPRHGSALSPRPIAPTPVVAAPPATAAALVAPPAPASGHPVERGTANIPIID